MVMLILNIFDERDKVLEMQEYKAGNPRKKIDPYFDNNNLSLQFIALSKKSLKDFADKYGYSVISHKIYFVLGNN